MSASPGGRTSHRIIFSRASTFDLIQVLDGPITRTLAKRTTSASARPSNPTWTSEPGRTRRFPFSQEQQSEHRSTRRCDAPLHPPMRTPPPLQRASAEVAAVGKGGLVAGGYQPVHRVTSLPNMQN